MKLHFAGKQFLPGSQWSQKNTTLLLVHVSRYWWHSKVSADRTSQLPYAAHMINTTIPYFHVHCYTVTHIYRYTNIQQNLLMPTLTASGYLKVCNRYSLIHQTDKPERRGGKALTSDLKESLKDVSIWKHTKQHLSAADSKNL